MAVNDLITFRKGPASQWISVNPVLASGEPGYDLTNSILKIGDGVSNWVSLSGIGSTSVGGSSSSSVGVRGVISTTGDLASFAVPGGYPVGYLDLFQDGIKLVSDLDFSATDGSNVTLSNSVPSGTVLEYLTISSGVSSGGGSDSRWDLFLPPAPASPVATAGNAQVALSWTAPTVLAQTPITDYTVQYSSNSGSTWTPFSDGTSTATSATVTGLSNGTAYVFRVAAVNGVGAGSYTAATNSVTPVPLLSLDYLLIGGGGGGGPARGGGGGAGGYLYGAGSAVLGSSLSVVVGNGGGNAQNGQNSSFALASGTVTALGGGRGADGLSGLWNGVGQAGGSGGSGGGGSGYAPAGAGGSGSQGNAGGGGFAGGEPYNGGGGGGAGGAGGSGSAAGGGVGRSTESAFLAAASAGVVSGGTRYIAAGGGSGSYNMTPGVGGLGGGGNGGNTNVVGTNGVANTGSGGGGGGNAANGGSGGSGVVILRVADTVTATTTGSPSVYVTGGYRYFKFTQSGTITFASETAPGAPTGVTGTAASGQVSLSWTAPASNGGAAITDYVVQYSSDSGSSWTTFSDGTSTATSATVTALTNGTAYVFRVAAVNSVGTGSFSSPSNPVGGAA